MSYDLFDGVDLPKRPYRTDAKYPFAGMAVNQSFFVPLKADDDHGKVLRRVAANAVRYRKVSGLDRKFTVRSTNHPGTGEACIGVWRTQ